MKRNTLLPSALFLSGICLLASCGEKDSTSDNTEIIDPVIPENPATGTLSAAEQKVLLDKAGQQLADQIKASDFAYYSDLARYVDDELSEQYEDSVITHWANDLLDQMLKQSGDTEHHHDEGENWVEDYYYTDYTQLIVLSNFTGHFTAKDRKWNYKKADDLQFTFPDQLGKECVLTLAVSGDSKDVYYGEDKHYSWSYLNQNNVSYYTHHIDQIAQTLRVPSQLKATFKQAGKTLAQLDATIDLKGMLTENFDLARDSYSANASLQVGEYTIQNARTNYSANTEAALSASLSKGSQTLLSMTAKGDGNYQREQVGKVSVVLDVLGLVQVKGIVNDGSAFVDYVNQANEYERDEKRFKSNIELANELLNLGVYYNGKNTREAKVQLEAFLEEDPWYSYWYCTPVIYFGDDSAYTTTDDFFGSGFDKLIAKLEKLLNDFQRLAE